MNDSSSPGVDSVISPVAAISTVPECPIGTAWNTIACAGDAGPAKTKNKAPIESRLLRMGPPDERA